MEKERKFSSIEFDLLENGLDFIDNSVKSILESKKASDLKYSILHISSGIELVLKEILRNEHWSLIFENVDKADYSRLISGDFQSVTFDKIIERLVKIANIEISNQNRKHISTIKKKRNKIEHFEFKDNDLAIKSNVSKALSSIIEIINENIKIDDYSNTSQKLYKDILKKSAKFNEFTSTINSRIGEDLALLNKRNIVLIDCPDCFQHTLPLDGSLTCLFCGYSDTSENIASAFAINILDYNSYYAYKYGGEDPVKSCPDCKTETLIFKDNLVFCINCDRSWDEGDLNLCDDCQEYFEGDNDIGICSGCWSRKLEEYD